MNCAWDAYMKLIPTWMKDDVEKYGKENLQELRLRIGRAPELVTKNGSKWIDGIVTQADLSFSINIAS